MGGKGLDFKHKEVININDARRLGYVQDVTADLETLPLLLYLVEIINSSICLLATTIL